jgi:hypothetical protein
MISLLLSGLFVVDSREAVVAVSGLRNPQSGREACVKLS